jgi:hypothetical protein
MIDKQNGLFYVLKCQFSPSLYLGTVFEGEVVDDHFLISDFLVYKDKAIVGHPLEKRLSLLLSIVSHPNYKYDSFLDPFKICVKDFVEYTELESFINDHMNTLPYKSKISGMIFRPVDTSNKNLIYNFNSSSKQQIQTEQSSSHVTKINTDAHKEVKFLLFETGNPDDYCLKLLDQSGHLTDYDYALVNDMKTSQYLQNTLDSISKTVKQSGVCVMCQYNNSFKKWKPIKIIDGTVPDKIAMLI